MPLEAVDAESAVMDVLSVSNMQVFSLLQLKGAKLRLIFDQVQIWFTGTNTADGIDRLHLGNDFTSKRSQQG